MGAYHNLGILYLQGEGIEKNAFKGFACVHKAAHQGATFAQPTLAYCYYFGLGTSKDVMEAKSYSFSWTKICAWVLRCLFSMIL